MNEPAPLIRCISAGNAPCVEVIEDEGGFFAASGGKMGSSIVAKYADFHRTLMSKTKSLESCSASSRLMLVDVRSLELRRKLGRPNEVSLKWKSVIVYLYTECSPMGRTISCICCCRISSSPLSIKECLSSCPTRLLLLKMRGVILSTNSFARQHLLLAHYIHLTTDPPTF